MVRTWNFLEKVVPACLKMCRPNKGKSRLHSLDRCDNYHGDICMTGGIRTARLQDRVLFKMRNVVVYLCKCGRPELCGSDSDAWFGPVRDTDRAGF